MPISTLFGQALPIARYRFTCRLHAPLWLPDYAGSMLRGVFGAALRHASCMTGLPRCGPCPLYRTCPYPALFETPPRETPLRQQFSQVPNPYIIEPPPLGARQVGGDAPLVFAMVLVGHEALRQLPLIVHAWQRALRHGLGRDRVAGQLQQVQWEGDDGQLETVFDASTPQVAGHTASLQLPPALKAQRITLHIETPLRLQHQGSPLRPHQLDVRTLALAAVRRASLMLSLHAGLAPPEDLTALLAEAGGLHEDRSTLRWHDWTRYSSRQQQEMTLGGVVGQWSLEGAVATILPWLWLGQWLHLGKNATMGMGRYRLAHG
jgi:hypothetical protein